MLLDVRACRITACAIGTGTVNYRVNSCEELLGRSVRERRIELQIALLLREGMNGVSFRPD